MSEKEWSIVVIIDGCTLKAVGDGTEEGTVFEGQDNHIAIAKTIIRNKFRVPLSDSRFGPVVTAGYESDISLTAALMNASPGDAVLWKAPKGVLEFIESYENKHNYEKRLYGKDERNQ